MNKIAIIGAMELEVEALIAKLSDSKRTDAAGMKFYEGVLNGADVVIVQCGVGKVNAALCVQILADRFAVTHVINTGIAGSLNPALDIGDIVVSRDACYHDADVTVFGYPQGQIPSMPLYFEADSRLGDLALEACARVNPDIRAIPGRIVSGDQFVASKDVKNKLVDVFHGDCTEMEGAAIAHGAYRNGLPFLILRAISDKADDSAEMDYPTFERAAAQHSAKLVEALVREI